MGNYCGFIIEDGILKEYVGVETDVVIPFGVKVIEAEAFHENENIKSVLIPGSVEKIQSDSFAKCINLTTVSFPNSIEEIEYDAGGNIKSLLVEFVRNDQAQVEGWRKGSSTDGKPKPCSRSARHDHSSDAAYG